ncbi:MAG TPA: hypothetical protein VMS96_14330 [Terriglobales bacterium]|nr:hypothetical protein [Terriglobales bacterium]
MADATLTGAVLSLTLFDVCEEIDLERLGAILSAPRVETAFKHSAPEYVRFERPPVLEHVGDVLLTTGDRVHADLKYYDYGVVSVTLERPFSGSWEDLLNLAKDWIWSPTFETDATALVRERLRRAAPAMVKPYQRLLTEDYFIFHVSDIEGQPTAEELVDQCGEMMARIVRGEPRPLSKAEVGEILQSTISYYPNDLAVIGWNAAFVYDAAANGTIQLLEYANSQLLEFRHYDELLTQELQRVYHSLEQGTGVIHRWKMAREASRLNTVRLDVTEIAERADNAIKFLSDMFAARLYRLAAAKVGVPDYKSLVNSKLRTGEELYRFMVDEFHQGRAFVLELIVVIILVVELVALFLGKM